MSEIDDILDMGDGREDGIEFRKIQKRAIQLMIDREMKNLVNEISGMHATLPYRTFRDWLESKYKPENIVAIELKDLSRTFTDSAEVNYTGQQIHQVIEVRLAELHNKDTQ